MSTPRSYLQETIRHLVTEIFNLLSTGSVAWQICHVEFLSPHMHVSHLLTSQATFDAVRTLVTRIQYLPHALIPTLAGNTGTGPWPHRFVNGWTLVICLTPKNWDGFPKHGDTTRKTIQERWMYIFLSYTSMCIWLCWCLHILICMYAYLHLHMYMHKYKFTCIYIYF